MAEVHLKVADAVIRKINDNLTKINDTDNGLTASQIGQEALGLYDWAIAKIADDFAICAMRNGEVYQVDLKSAPVRENGEFPEVRVRR